MPRKSRLPTATEWAHHYLATQLSTNAHLIDATAGNGHDALFLSQFILPDGHLYLFDIQEVAIQTTRSLLLSNEIPASNTSLFQCSHTELKERIPSNLHGAIDAVVFNLGYLPGQDKTLTTLSDSTLAALESSLELLKPGGILSVITYPGHATGAEEALCVTNWMKSLPSSAFEVQRLQALNRLAPPPELWIVKKS
ncbi:MAG: class I SAM-dependent methyltransferase [Verrucomicrobiota bacterium]